MKTVKQLLEEFSRRLLIAGATLHSVTLDDRTTARLIWDSDPPFDEDDPTPESVVLPMPAGPLRVTSIGVERDRMWVENPDRMGS